MIPCTLFYTYFTLYFHVEGALNYHLIQKNIKNTNGCWGFNQLLEKSLCDSELKTGLKILGYARNSAHGEGGTFIFSMSKKQKKGAGTEIIIEHFKDKKYTFVEGSPVSLSYEFLRDIIPEICILYKSLFLPETETSPLIFNS